MWGAEEDVGEVEEPCFVLDMQQLWSEEFVELGVELRVLQIVFRYQSKDTRQGQERDGATNIVGGHQEVSHQQWLGHVGKHLVIKY